MSIAHKLHDKKRTEDVLISESVDFSGLLLSKSVLQGLTKAGFQRPSPIQLKAIPLGRCGLDLIVQAKSGTGKTCVFTVVALEGINITAPSTQVLVLAPTREIALQIQEVVQSVGAPMTGLKCHTFIGGTPVLQDKILTKNCHIAVGTPGRIKQLIDIGALKTNSIRLFVLDEADKLLEGDFQESINFIYSTLPQNKQIIALSATYPEYLAHHLTSYMRNPTFVRLNIIDPALIGIKQYHVVVPTHPLLNIVFKSKTEAVVKILSSVSFQQCLIFSNLQIRAKNLQSELQARNWPTACIAGCLDQKERNFAMEQLKTYKCRILISTDLTSRGIDADKVNLVICLDVPKDHETYLHRIGRAGRFGSYGAAITIVSEGGQDKELWTVERKCKTRIPKLPDPIPKDLISKAETIELDNVSTEQIINHPDTAAGICLDTAASIPVPEALNPFQNTQDCPGTLQQFSKESPEVLERDEKFIAKVDFNSEPRETLDTQSEFSKNNGSGCEQTGLFADSSTGDQIINILTENNTSGLESDSWKQGDDLCDLSTKSSSLLATGHNQLNSSCGHIESMSINSSNCCTEASCLSFTLENNSSSQSDSKKTTVDTNAQFQTSEMGNQKFQERETETPKGHEGMFNCNRTGVADLENNEKYESHEDLVVTENAEILEKTSSTDCVQPPALPEQSSSGYDYEAEAFDGHVFSNRESFKSVSCLQQKVADYADSISREILMEAITAQPKFASITSHACFFNPSSELPGNREGNMTVREALNNAISDDDGCDKCCIAEPSLSTSLSDIKTEACQSEMSDLPVLNIGGQMNATESRECTVADPKLHTVNIISETTVCSLKSTYEENMPSKDAVEVDSSLESHLAREDKNPDENLCKKTLHKEILAKDAKTFTENKNRSSLETRTNSVISSSLSRSDEEGKTCSVIASDLESSFDSVGRVGNNLVSSVNETLTNHVDSDLAKENSSTQTLTNHVDSDLAKENSSTQTRAIAKARPRRRGPPRSFAIVDFFHSVNEDLRTYEKDNGTCSASLDIAGGGDCLTPLKIRGGARVSDCVETEMAGNCKNTSKDILLVSSVGGGDSTISPFPETTEENSFRPVQGQNDESITDSACHIIYKNKCVAKTASENMVSSEDAAEIEVKENDVIVNTSSPMEVAKTASENMVSSEDAAEIEVRENDVTVNAFSPMEVARSKNVAATLALNSLLLQKWTPAEHFRFRDLEKGYMDFCESFENNSSMSTVDTELLKLLVPLGSVCSSDLQDLCAFEVSKLNSLKSVFENKLRAAVEEVKTKSECEVHQEVTKSISNSQPTSEQVQQSSGIEKYKAPRGKIRPEDSYEHKQTVYNRNHNRKSKAVAKPSDSLNWRKDSSNVPASGATPKQNRKQQKNNNKGKNLDGTEASINRVNESDVSLSIAKQFAIKENNTEKCSLFLEETKMLDQRYESSKDCLDLDEMHAIMLRKRQEKKAVKLKQQMHIPNDSTVHSVDGKEISAIVLQQNDLSSREQIGESHFNISSEVCRERSNNSMESYIASKEDGLNAIKVSDLTLNLSSDTNATPKTNIDQQPSGNKIDQKLEMTTENGNIILLLFEETREKLQPTFDGCSIQEITVSHTNKSPPKMNANVNDKATLNSLPENQPLERQNSTNHTKTSSISQDKKICGSLNQKLEMNEAAKLMNSPKKQTQAKIQSVKGSILSKYTIMNEAKPTKPSKSEAKLAGIEVTDGSTSSTTSDLTFSSTSDLSDVNLSDLDKSAVLNSQCYANRYAGDDGKGHKTAKSGHKKEMEGKIGKYSSNFASHQKYPNYDWRSSVTVRLNGYEGQSSLSAIPAHLKNAPFFTTAEPWHNLPYCKDQYSKAYSTQNFPSETTKSVVGKEMAHSHIPNKVSKKSTKAHIDLLDKHEVSTKITKMRHSDERIRIETPRDGYAINDNKVNKKAVNRQKQFSGKTFRNELEDDANTGLIYTHDSCNECFSNSQYHPQPIVYRAPYWQHPCHYPYQPLSVPYQPYTYPGPLYRGVHSQFLPYCPHPHVPPFPFQPAHQPGHQNVFYTANQTNGPVHNCPIVPYYSPHQLAIASQAVSMQLCYVKLMTKQLSRLTRKHKLQVAKASREK